MLLFTPGPTPVPESVRQAMALPTLHHRTPEFEAIFAETRELLHRLMGLQEVLMFASSGSGAMEACITNLCMKKALVVDAGKFGERFGKIAQAHGKEVVTASYEWNTPADVDQIESLVKNDPEIDTLCMQICESAGGLRHPVEEIARRLKAIRPEIKVIADGITAVGVEPIDVTHIDALIAGSQKAFMLPPGLAMVALSQHALDHVEQHGGAGFYFNFASELKNQRKNTTAWTAATTLIIGLREILKQMFDLGIETLYTQTQARAVATREALSALGLSVYPNTPASAMTALYHEEQAEAIRKMLKTEYGINVAGGQEQLKGKLFRINHMGLIPLYESSWVVNAVELAMDRLGMRSFDGAANALFLKRYAEAVQG